MAVLRHDGTPDKIHHLGHGRQLRLNGKLRRTPHRPLLPRCWELRDNLTIYDAAYVALAEALEVLLLTGDGRLAKATGPTCNIEILQAL